MNANFAGVYDKQDKTVLTDVDAAMCLFVL